MVAAGDVVRTCSTLLGNVPAYELAVGDVGATAALVAATAADSTSSRARRLRYDRR
jgi:hypothetical protein